MRLKYKGKRPCNYRGAVFIPNEITTVPDEIGAKLKNLPDWQEVKGRGNGKNKARRDPSGAEAPGGTRI